MRTVLAILIMMYSIFVHAQTSRLGIVGQPCLTYYSLTGGNPSSNSAFRAAEKPIFTYQLGFLYTKSLSAKVDFVTGLLYAQRGSQTQYVNSNIYALSLSPGYSSRVVDRSLEIPLYANIYLKKSAVSFFFTVGLKPSFYIGSFSQTNGLSSQRSSYYYSAHRKLNVFAALGFGTDIKLAEKWQLTLWPILEHALINEVFAQSLNAYPYSAGINLCLFYSLGN